MIESKEKVEISHFSTIVSGMAGVALMTLFSSIISIFSKHELTEHKVLSKLIKRARFKLDRKTSYLLGWKGHILAGIGFSYLNKALLENKLIKPTVNSAIPVGLIEGLFGIMIWSIAFAMHSNPPKLSLKKYFSQLVFAHLVYATVSILGMRRK